MTIKPLLKNELLVNVKRIKNGNYEISIVRHDKQSALGRLAWLKLNYNNEFLLPSYFHRDEAELVGLQIAVLLCNKNSSYDSIFVDRSKITSYNIKSREIIEKAKKYITINKRNIKILDIKNKFL